MHPAALLPAALAAAAALPAPAGALGLPETFPRTIVITGTGQGVRVGQFDVTTRPAGTRVRVTVRVRATALRGRRPLLIGVAPCTGGTRTSPACRPRWTARLTATTAGVRATRTALVARPASNPGALRVTLTAGTRTSDIPSATRNVGGGGGTAEILLNGGTWRSMAGSPWGVTAAPPSGVTIDRVWFNSRRYEWNGLAAAGTPVTTTFGYEGAPPVWTFRNTMAAGRPFGFYRTPTRPLQDRRTVPRAYSYSAASAAGRLFTLRVPLPPYAGR